MSTQIKSVSGTGVPLLLDDIDTDRIIPARYLRCVTFDGLGEFAFEDDRQQDPGHPFNKPEFAGASVLIAGRNFGCGSSRKNLSKVRGVSRAGRIRGEAPGADG